MSISLVELAMESIGDTGADTLVAYHFEEERPLRGLAGHVDWRMNGSLSKMVQKGVATGRSRDMVLTPGRRQFPVQRILLTGLGKKAAFGGDQFRAASLATLRTLLRLPSSHFALELPGGARHGLSPRAAIEMWLTAYHQTVLNLGVDARVTLIGTKAEIEDWKDPLHHFQSQFTRG